MAKNKKTGQATPPPPLSDDDCKLIRQLYVDGVSIDALAEKFERDPPAIGEVLRNGSSRAPAMHVLSPQSLGGRLLIAGARGYICNGCGEACVQIILDEQPGCVLISLTADPKSRA